MSVPKANTGTDLRVSSSDRCHRKRKQLEIDGGCLASVATRNHPVYSVKKSVKAQRERRGRSRFKRQMSEGIEKTSSEVLSNWTE